MPRTKQHPGARSMFGSKQARRITEDMATAEFNRDYEKRYEAGEDTATPAGKYRPGFIPGRGKSK